VKHPGCLRNEGVGVYAGGVVTHAAPPPNVVPQLMGDLFGWLRTSRDHPLVKGSVFHYEFEFIHPFMDGNGRTGRLWHSLLLRAWRPVFAWLPVETLIHQNQQDYYDAIMASTNAASSTPFIEFMLGTTRNALLDVLAQQAVRVQPDDNHMQPHATGKQPESNHMQPDTSDRDARVVAHLAAVGTASAASIAALLGLSKDRTRAVLRDMARRGLIRKLGAGRSTRYALGEQ
jgi:Fic family protein